ncbi:Mitogen-activated protein kinase kinase kinase YODA [Leucoagaricus sp. SymC.cos]|nr:Mitogen-activated protein kinase kinase kinase YODA [Leucoagaricus sp. SymC.cos]
MWDKPEVHTGAVMKQERSLAQEFWAGYGKNGSRVERFRRPQQSIWDILEPVIGKKPSQADSYSTPRIQGLPRVLANFFSSKPDSMNARNVCRVLLLEILQHPQKIAQFCDLLGDDAQLLLNLSSQLLRERSSFQAADWTALLSLSCKLAMSAQLYPQSFTLNGVSYNPKRPSVGQGGFAFVHKGTYKNKPVCLKVPREPGVESLAVSDFRSRDSNTRRSDLLWLVLIDTPGFGINESLNAEVLSLILGLLSEEIFVSAILYMHPISDRLFNFTPKLTLDLLKSICRSDRHAELVFVTTMWDKPGVHTGAAMKQEQSLAQEFWTGYGKNGSRVEQFRRPQQSAWDILELVIGKKADSYSTPRIQGLPRVLANFFSSKPDSMNARNVCRVLLLEILQHPQKIAQFCDLLGDDAQLLLNLSSQLLRERSSFQAADWTALLSLSCKLAMSAQLYPQSFTLNGVSYNPKRPSVGQGGFAFVHKGTYKNKPVCLKVPREPGVESLAVHLKELFLWAHLMHRSILPFYGASTIIDKKLCLVAPWIEGGNLCDFAASHPQEERWPLILDVMDGVEYLHGLGVIHGNLKGKKVLVSSDRRAVITGFGQSDVTTSSVGIRALADFTIRWAAPEVLFPRSSSNIVGSSSDSNHTSDRLIKPSDIWSLGCLIYEALSCKPPYHQYSDAQAATIIITKREVPQRPIDGDSNRMIGEETWGHLVSCWAFDPAGRPECTALAEALRDLNQTSLPSPSTGNQATHSLNLDSGQKLKVRIDFERAVNLLREGWDGLTPQHDLQVLK